MLHVFAIVFDCTPDECAGIAIAADKLGRWRKCQIEQVVEDKNLPVAVRSGADADRRNSQLAADSSGHLARNAFKHDCTGTCIGEGKRVRLELKDSFCSAGLHAIAAHTMYALWCQAQMAHHRNLCFCECANQVDARPLNFHRLGPCFLDETDGVAKPFSDCAVITSKRHICDNECATHGAMGSASVVEHLVDREI